MSIEALKEKVKKEIDKNRDKIIALGRNIYKEPEMGYKEVSTTAKVVDVLRDLGCHVEENIAVTGCRARVSKGTGPRLAMLGELDCISCKGHPDAKTTGEVHGCGHNIQIAGLLGAAIGLISSGVLEEIRGTIDFLATPAEEFIDLDYRQQLRDKKVIEFFGGKQELIKRGYFDDVDIAMMFHCLDLEENKGLVGTVSNGFIGKKIKFIGKASHAGSSPDQGINALNAAMLAINNINAQRETFKEKDRIRVHHIITKGGDVVNVVPSEVIMECYVRARNVEAMIDTNKKVDRALRAGALAIGAKVEITDIPGYLPILNYKDLDNVFKTNLELLGLNGKITDQCDFTGSFDFGDLSHLMPTLHPMIGGIEGSLHSEEYRIVDEELAYIVPAKAMATTAVDLLYNNGEIANRIIKNNPRKLNKEEYLNWIRAIGKVEIYGEEI